MIRLENVSKSFRTRSGRHVVLDNVSAEFPTGTSVGILGLNGAGKSTLINIIGGTEPADHGRIHRDVTLSWPIGFAGGFPGRVTGREAARFVARIYGVPDSEIVDFVQDFAELGTFFDEPVASYSSGMTQRLSVAISLAANFQCYLVDEAVSAGDQRFRTKYRNAFKQRVGRASMIMVSHNESTIREFCEVGAILHERKLHIFSSMKEAIREYRKIAVNETELE